MRSVVVVVGTRPEAIKMAPVVRALAARRDAKPILVSTGQHLELLADALSAFGLSADHRLNVMSEGQTPNDVVSRVCASLPPLLSHLNPEALLVQGDTTTTLSAAMCAYHARIPVGHVEAGLRTYDYDHPFPEEANRQMCDRIAHWCFAPVASARDNLLSERIDPARIHVTGNTAVDAVLWMVKTLKSGNGRQGDVLMTLHRRESFGKPLTGILLGVRDFLDEVPAARVRWPVHPNPNVRASIQSAFSDTTRVDLMEPMGYADFAAELASCRFVLTDSGGIQEEGPSLGKTVLVAREATERPEAIGSGQNRLVGRTRAGVRDALLQAWSEPPYAGPIPAPNPFGDGRAAERIADLVLG